MDGTTLWSRVLTAADAASPDRREALEFLVTTYWRPVYHLFRKLGAKEDEAPDLTQEFFGRLMEGDVLRSANPERGRFRAYLRTSAKNFLINEWERRGAAKRGGGARHLSLDFEGAERLLEPGVDASPERAFDRQWALDLLQGCIELLERECRESGQAALFQAVRSAFALDGTPHAPTQARIADELSISEQDVANFLFRARRRLREILRDKVRASVATEGEVDDEIRGLFAALS